MSLLKIYPKSWYEENAEILPMIMEACQKIFDRLSTDIAQAKLGLNVTSANEFYLDLHGIDYRVTRMVGESDSDYRVRIQNEMLRQKNTVSSIIAALDTIETGQSRVYEPWQNLFKISKSALSGPDKIIDYEYWDYHVIDILTRIRSDMIEPTLLKIISAGKTLYITELIEQFRDDSPQDIEQTLNDTFIEQDLEKTLIDDILTSEQITLSRASTAYKKDNTQVANNVPRFDPGAYATFKEGTTNLVPLANQKFVGWTPISGAIITLTQDQVVPEWSATDTTRIQTSGGSSMQKYVMTFGISTNGMPYTNSVYVKNIGAVAAKLAIGLGDVRVIQPGEVGRFSVSGTGNGTSWFMIDLSTTVIAHSLDIIAWHPQMETKDHCTEFTTGIRMDQWIPHPVWGYNLMIEEAETNLIGATGDFETDSNSDGLADGWGLWSSDAGRVLIKSRVAALVHGSYSQRLEIVAVAAGGDSTMSSNVTGLTSGANYTVSATIKTNTLLTHIMIRWYNTAGTFIRDSPLTYTTKINEAHLVKVSDIAPAEATRAGIYIRGISQVGHWFEVDGVQFEAKAYATTWHDSIRAAEVVTFPTDQLSLDEGFTIEKDEWINANALRQVAGQNNRVWQIDRSIGGAGIALLHVANSANWQLAIYNDAGTASYSAVISDSLTPVNSMARFKITVSRTEIKVYVNNTLRATMPNPNLPSALGTGYLGSNGAANFLNTSICGFRLTKGTETVSDSLLSPLQTTPNTILLSNFNNTLNTSKPGKLYDQDRTIDINIILDKSTRSKKYLTWSPAVQAFSTYPFEDLIEIPYLQMGWQVKNEIQGVDY